MCLCVCDVSHGTRLTQHPLASHNIPFGLSVPGLSPCPAAQLQVRRIGSWGKAGDPFEKRGPILDPTSQITPSLFLSCPMLFLSRGGEGRGGQASKQASTRLGEPWSPPLSTSTTTSSVQRANQ